MRRYQVIAILAVAAVLLLVLIGLGYTQSWTGFQGYKEGGQYYPTKMLWDWMDLILIPVVLVLGGFLLNQSARRNEREIAINRQHQQTLETYYDRMTKLILDEKLHDPSEQRDSVRTIARARTLAVLRSLQTDGNPDGNRKGQVAKFLYENKLLNNKGCNNEREAIIKLHGPDEDVERRWAANLSGTNLPGASLICIDLHGVNLIGADLQRANLSEANLSEADLSQADLSQTDLRGAMLRGATLRGANLSQAKYDDDTIWPDGFDPEVEGAVKVE